MRVHAESSGCGKDAILTKSGKLALKTDAGDLPCVSVIVCVQGDETLKIADRIAFASHFKPESTEDAGKVEVVVVDSSKDSGVRDLIRTQVEAFDGIYVEDRQEWNRYSLARARNVGAVKASGEFLLFADVDLVPSKGFAAKLLHFVESGRLSKAPNHFSIIPVLYLSEHVTLISTDDVLSSTLTDWLHGPRSNDVDSLQLVNSSILVHRTFFLHLGGQHPGFKGWGMEDWHFLWKLMSFPQPVPGLKKQAAFHHNPPQAKNRLASWRDSALFLGDEALRHELFLLHMPHPRRVLNWRDGSVHSERRFKALVEDQVIIEKNLELKTGPSYRVFSDDPILTNWLLFPHDAAVETADVSTVRARAGWKNFAITEKPVIGAIRPTRDDYRAIAALAKSGRDFDLLYHPGLPRTAYYFSFEDGKLLQPISNTMHPLPELWENKAREGTRLNAERFRNGGWRRNKFLVLFALTEDIFEQDGESGWNAPFGLDCGKFRSLISAIAPLIGPDCEVMIYDTTDDGDGAGLPFDNVHDVSSRSISMLIEAADVVVSQSPSLALNAVVHSTPTITTGDLFSELLPELPIARQLYDVAQFIEDARDDPNIIRREVIERIFSHACIYIADDVGAPAPADILRRTGVTRVLYEQIATPKFTNNFCFDFGSENSRLHAWRWPHIDLKDAEQLHLQPDIDYWFLRSLIIDVGSKRDKYPKSSRKAAIKKPPSSASPINILKKKYIASENERRAMYKASAMRSPMQRKIAKLKRDPRQFFADSSVGPFRILRHLFPA